MPRKKRKRQLGVEELECRRVLSSATPLPSSPGLGINISNLSDYSPDLLFANAMMTVRPWGTVNTPWDQAAAKNTAGWPTEDAGVVVTDPTGGDVGGTYALSFNGEATVTGLYTTVSVNNQVYNPVTNTTTATLVVAPDQGSLYLDFTNTHVTGNSPTDTGVTNVVLMRPEVTDGNTPYPAGTMFTTNIQTLIENFQVVRYMDFTQTNDSTQVNWSDRTLPGAATQTGTNGGAWEYAVMLANATNTNMWINIPAEANTQYVTDLADLLKYGSDGTNPYTSPQAHPVYPPLNPNLKVYFEYSNEVWNFGFQQYNENLSMAETAVANGTEPLNYDNVDNNYIYAFRRVADQTVIDSNIFRSVFGDAAMMTQIRPVFDWQYANDNNTAQTALDFLNNYYDNGDGIQHVANPHPVNYYIWGGGGAWYYTVNDASGNGDVVVPDGGFNVETVSGYQQDPTGSDWSFIGTAGIAANGSSLGNPNAPVSGSGVYNGSTAPYTTTQAGYISGTGSFSQSFNFSGGYSTISFNAASWDPVGGDSGNEGVQVYYDNTLLGPNSYSFSFTPYSSSYSVEVTLPFDASAGSGTVELVGTGGTGTIFISDVTVQTVNAMYNSGTQLDSGSGDQNLTTLVNTEAQWATAYGLQMVSYEGGFHVGGDSPTPLQTIANLDARAQAIEASGIATFFQQGGNLAMFYDTTDLSYELTNDLDNLNTPKLLAIYAALSAGLPSATVGTALPTTIGQAVAVPETNNSTYYASSQTNADIFLVQVTKPGVYSIQINGQQGVSTTNERIMVDGMDVSGTLKVPTSPSFGLSASAITFTITTPGLHAISVLSDGTGQVSLSGNAEVTLLEPVVSLASASQSVNENGGTFSITVSLSVAPTVSTTVPFTLSGTAVNGTNYTLVASSPLTFAVGQTTSTVTFTLLDSGKYVPYNSTLIFTLGTPTNAALGSITSDTVTIVETDPEPTVSLSTSAQSVLENAGTFTVTVTLSAASGVSTTVPFTLSGSAVSGTNYNQVTTSPITIPAGQTTGTFTFTALDDGQYHSNRTLVVTLGTPTNATVGTIGSDTVTIVQLPPPASKVSALTTRQSSLSFPVTVTGNDPSPGPGIASYDIYVSTNGGPFLYWTNVTPSNTTATFNGASNTTYAFHSIAHDLSGNVEVKIAVAVDASTYVPDLTAPVPQISATPSANGTFAISYSGTAPGGSGISSFTVSVKVDSGSTQTIGTYPAGTAVSGTYSGQTTYQGLLDGLSHTYTFYVTATNGNSVQSAPVATLPITQTFGAPVTPAVTAFSVEKGLSERSYIRYLDVTFNQVATGLNLNNTTVTLEQFNLAGTQLVNTIDLTGKISLIDHVMEIDFGAGGIGGSENLANSVGNWSALTAADGYYKLLINTGGLVAEEDFYRLFGDVIGNSVGGPTTTGTTVGGNVIGKLSNADITAIAAAVGQTASVQTPLLNADINGAGIVTSNDRLVAQKSISAGRSLAAGLNLSD